MAKLKPNLCTAPVIHKSTSSYSDAATTEAPATLEQAQLRLRLIQDAAFGSDTPRQRLKRIQGLIKKPYPKEDPAD